MNPQNLGAISEITCSCYILYKVHNRISSHSPKLSIGHADPKSSHRQRGVLLPQWAFMGAGRLSRLCWMTELRLETSLPFIHNKYKLLEQTPNPALNYLYR